MGDGHGTDPQGKHGHKDAAPADLLGQESADKRPDRQPHVDGRHIDADGPAALSGREDGGQNGHAGGHEQGRAQPLDHPQEEKPGGGVDHRRGRGTGGVYDQADAEHPLAAVDVSQLAGRDQADGHGQQVGGRHPAQFHGRHLQIFLDGRQGHIDRGDHERTHERGQRGHEQGGSFQGGLLLRNRRLGLLLIGVQ